MADIKMNQATTLQDVAYIYAEANNGSLGKVSHSRLRETIIKSDYNTSVVDCNNMKEEGKYAAYQWENSPISFIGVLEVIKYSSDWIMQVMYGINSNPNMYIRSFYSGTTWSAWKQLF